MTATRDFYTAATPGAITGDDMLDRNAANVGALFDSANLWLTNVAGTANVVTADVVPDFDAAGLKAGMKFGIKWAQDNTGAVFLKINDQPLKSVLNIAGLALVAGDLRAGLYSELVYDGTQFVIATPLYPHVVGAQSGVPGFAAYGQSLATLSGDLCPIETVEINSIGATLLNNKVTFPAGEYWIEAVAQVRLASQLGSPADAGITLVNDTTATDLIVSALRASALGTMEALLVRGKFTFGSNTDLSVRYNQAASAFGHGFSSYGGGELRPTMISAWKIN